NYRAVFSRLNPHPHTSEHSFDVCLSRGRSKCPERSKAMAYGKFVSYLRVSTARQGISGLGLEAPREAVASYLNGGRWSLVQEVVEVESGKRNDRPAIAEALRL